VRADDACRLDVVQLREHAPEIVVSERRDEPELRRVAVVVVERVEHGHAVDDATDGHEVLRIELRVVLQVEEQLM
jgi:hypothetical protein